ncbi:hypothetical protein J4Q44_G00056730 [Coregonus suidteri]|uniref:Uncharacterized protein n=1 Tax=Coregonus suidteri TaxID=861788 RepID=A0AAN8M6H7_9TELE
MESEQLFNRKGYYRNSYNSIASASSDEELLDGTGVVMDFHTSEDDNLLDGDATSPGRLTANRCRLRLQTPTITLHGAGLLTPGEKGSGWVILVR